MPARILIVDDDRAVRNALKINLSKHGFVIEAASSSADAVALMSTSSFDLVLTDVRMPGGSGLALLEVIRKKWPATSVIVMTGFGSVDDAVRAMKNGASEYLIKPMSRDAVLILVDRVLKERRMLTELSDLREQTGEGLFGNLVGNSLAMRQVYELARNVAATSATVLLQGPTGTGKELLAQAIHEHSARKTASFVRINCGALPETLLESELFGHEKGAFTGAVRLHRGRFELADGGTLLLDEIGEISPLMQVKLLRVLQEGEFERLGGMETLKVDVRVIAATNRVLSEDVDAGRFRRDLFYRLNVFGIQLPSLRERREDIPLLVERFVRKYVQKNRKKILRVEPECMDRLMAHHWPGNIRELENVIEKAVILTLGETIESVDLPVPAQPTWRAAGRTLSQALRDCERETIMEALRAAGGVQARAAVALGISRSNLNYRINRLGLRVEDALEG